MKESEHSFYDRLKKSKNVLLVRTEVGRGKSCTRTLPPTEHSYGYHRATDKEGVGSIISSWQVHKPTKELYPQKDYGRLNKLGAVSHITKAKQVKSFREQHIFVVKRKRNSSYDSYRATPAKDLAHGIRNRPSTPISKIVNFDYGNQAMVNTHHVYLKSKGTSKEQSIRKSVSTCVPRSRMKIKIR